MDEKEPAKAPVRGAIVIPTFGLWLELDPLCADIKALLDDAERVRFLNPCSAFWRLNRISRKRSALRAQYESAIHKCLERTTQHVDGPVLDSAALQTWSKSIGEAVLFRIHSLWGDLGATVDRRFAYALASLSLYIASVSLVATVVLGITSLR